MLSRLVRTIRIFCLLAALATPVVAEQGPAPRVDAQRTFDQYVPIDQLPATERMPAAPFVISAYAVVWLLAMLYIGTIWQRVNRLEGELRALERRKGTAR